jgi:hypothetical protein
MNTVIKVENLGKKYLIRHEQRERYTALRDVMANNVKRLGRKLLSPFTIHHSQSSNLPYGRNKFCHVLDVKEVIKQCLQ